MKENYFEKCVVAFIDELFNGNNREEYEKMGREYVGKVREDSKIPVSITYSPKPLIESGQKLLREEIMNK